MSALLFNITIDRVMRYTLALRSARGRQNVQDPAPVKVDNNPLPYTEQFTYLGSTIRHNGGAGSDISNRIGKARNAFRILNPMWKSQQ